MSYSPTEVQEETDVTVGRAREMVEERPVTWVDVLDPDARTLEELETLFGLHPLALEDASRAHTPPKVEPYGDVLFLVARAIVWAEEITTEPLSLFLSKRVVVTVHRAVFPQLEDVRVKIRRRSPRVMKGGADYLCYSILDVLVDSYFPHLDRMERVVDAVEAEVIAPSADPRGITKLHAIRSDLLMLRNALRPQRDAFTTLARLDTPFFRKETRDYLRDVYDHAIRALDTLDTYREIVASLMEVHSALVSNNINEVIKALTVVFTVTLPVAIITSAFGMNVEFPGREGYLGLGLALLLMAATTAATALYMKRRRLL